jgi:hypothetical protein
VAHHEIQKFNHRFIPENEFGKDSDFEFGLFRTYEYKVRSVQVQVIMLIFIDKCDFVFDEWGLSTTRTAS